jgi:hypothetical protein
LKKEKELHLFFPTLTINFFQYFLQARSFMNI